MSINVLESYPEIIQKFIEIDKTSENLIVQDDEGSLFPSVKHNLFQVELLLEIYKNSWTKKKDQEERESDHTKMIKNVSVIKYYFIYHHILLTFQALCREK